MKERLLGMYQVLGRDLAGKDGLSGILDTTVLKE
jgi:hypothetical protein